MSFELARVISRRSKIILICLLLGFITIALYWPVTGFDFVNFDDNLYVTNNSWVQNGFSFKSVIWAFTTHHDFNRDPITWLSYFLDDQIYGLRPGGYHLTNVLFHTANTLLLFGLLWRLTGAVWRSAFVAALFAWHPMHVESVAWISERKDVLSTFFALLTLWAYWVYTKSPNWKRYGLALLCFALGLMAKPMLVTLPLLLLLLDYWPLQRSKHLESKSSGSNYSWFGLMLEKTPFFLLSAISSWITLRVQVFDREQLAIHHPLGERLANALNSYVCYIEKLVWPENLSIFYPYPHHLSFWHVAGTATILIAISTWICICMHRCPHLVVGWLWFLITLLPVIGLIQVGEQGMADRYTYIPSIGLFIAFSWEIDRLLVPMCHVERVLGWGATGTLAACLMVASCQLRYWKNSVALFTHAIAVTEDNPVAQCNLGQALSDEGEWSKALTHFDKALRLRPKFAIVLNDKGSLLYRQGKYQAAAAALNAALALRPYYSPAHYNLGQVWLALRKPEEAEAQFRLALDDNPASGASLVGLGLCLAKRGQMEGAIAQYQAALKLSPDCEAENAWGVALESQGKIGQALAHYRMALKFNPNFAEAQCNVGAILTEQGKYDEAIECFQTALKSKPEFAEAHYDLGNARIGLGELDEAARQYTQAVRFNPDYMEAHFNLGNVFFQQQQWTKALKQFAAAAMLETNFAGAQIRMAMVLGRMGKAGAAVEHYQVALRLQPQSTMARQGLAWILATDPDPAVRNGTEAVHLALAAAQRGDNPVVWDTLGAAYAETGKFNRALSVAAKAINFAERAGDSNLVAKIQARVQLYKRQQPFHESE